MCRSRMRDPKFAPLKEMVARNAEETPIENPAGCWSGVRTADVTTRDASNQAKRESMIWIPGNGFLMARPSTRRPVTLVFAAWRANKKRASALHENKVVRCQ